MKSISRRGLLKMGAALAAAPSAVRVAGAAQRSTTSPDGGALEPRWRAPVNPERHLLLRGGTIITMDPAVGDLARGDVHIRGKHIVEEAGMSARQLPRRSSTRQARSSFRGSSIVTGIHGRRSSDESFPTV